MISTARLCEGLEISQHRLEQWISRGHLTPENAPERGKARLWSLADTMRAEITKRLMVSGVIFSVVGRDDTQGGPLSWSLRGLHGRKGAAAVLILYPRFPGGPLMNKIIPAEEIASYVLGKPKDPGSFFLAINLDTIEADLIETFPEFAKNEG